ncbi:MAG: HAD-IA family hydrolase [Deltaproteobacteria bacterium]|nr:HAD-IA family hydrolase [Deltaproteobacteria bacterium]
MKTPRASFSVKAVLFDFDGTLTAPGALDFSAIKQALGCPAHKPVLEFIESLTDYREQERAFFQLEHFEMSAAANAQPNRGAEELIQYLRAQDVRVGIISRNSRQAIHRSLQNFTGVTPSDFDVIIARDESINPKPSGDGILLAGERLGVTAADIVMVGDYIFDIQSGKDAGALTVFLTNRPEYDSLAIDSDYTISSLDELKGIIRLGLPLPPGKLPHDLLEVFLSECRCDDPSVLIGPGIGEDSAAVSIGPETVLTLTADPITFVTDAIAHYAVLINANDIATAGAIPRWFLASLLVPSGTTPSTIRQIMHELDTSCHQWGISLCGGHTEITDAVTRPLVSGMLVGTVPRHNLIDKRSMCRGDKVLLTKAVAVEGTAIIVREHGEQLRRLGMDDDELAECRRFISRIGILEEAALARDSKGVTALHDVTEGGLATALDELSRAGGRRIRVEVDKIPVLPQTEKVCRLLKLHPLGLIGSGSLLICCSPGCVKQLMDKMRGGNIMITAIGEVLEEGRGIEAVRKNVLTEWPCFAADEITRVLGSNDISSK